MLLHKFIFSDQFKYRLSRHIAFWLCWMLFASIVQVSGPLLTKLSFGDVVLFQIVRTTARIAPQIVFCYFVVYFLSPRFIPQRKYFQFFLSFIAAFLALSVLTAIYFSFTGGLQHVFLKYPRFSPFIAKFYGFYSNINFTGAIPACCLMFALKYYKRFIVEQRKNEMLKLENTHAELQMLKAQVHPHFLFNTLNNIYAFTLTKEPSAAELVDKLAGMVDYMRKEGAKPHVDLEQEIQLLHDYIGLEKIRYGNRLNMQINIDRPLERKPIAPLLMIPFVENSFKHGISKTRGQQWIELDMKIDENVLDFRLSNSKTPGPPDMSSKKGIGLANVEKRLNLLYPGKHELVIENNDHSFIVRLKIYLD